MPSFRAKARAVDLLGKGQIADLPTAICELWKNGYDAYADNLCCDLHLSGYKGLESPIFTLSDDGIGMSRKDIEEKWIVLGTDSRARGVELLSEEERLGKPLRIPMGEKGIGRLSVAYLGPKMLMVTKKRNEECLMLFMDWRILENFNLYLDDVDVPINSVSSEDTATEVFDRTVAGFRRNLESDNWEEHKPLSAKISEDLEKIRLPKFLVEEVLAGYLRPDTHGTIFVIFDPHDQLLELVPGERIDIRDTLATNYLRSSLSGIYNAFREDRTFKTSFWIHDSAGKYDIVSKELFFAREDFSNADHYLTGSFDEEGFFRGEFRVFDSTIQHNFRARRPPGPTPYGPFTIEFGFMEGDPKNSKLPREKWDIIMKKCQVFGGLYIYRDNFRVLPYGRTEYDFLRFEERRTKSATYYQFSHRRIFGYVEIGREKNRGLKDKAGREGFIVNKAYREFQNDLIEFFVDLAVRYLRTITPDEKEKGDLVTLREQQVEAIKQRNKRVLRAEKKRSKMTATRFRRELKENSTRISSVMSETEDAFDRLKDAIEKKPLVYNEIELLISEIEKKKLELKKMKMTKPRRIKLTDSQTNKYYAYLEGYAESIGLVRKCDLLISETQKRLSKENLEEEFRRRYEDYKSSVKSTTGEYESRFGIAVTNLQEMIKADIKFYSDVYAEKTGHLVPTGEEEKTELEERLTMLGKIHDAIRDEIEEKFESFTRHVEGLSFEIDDDLLVGWYKDQYEKIQEKVEAMHELAQLGMAIEIIDHQFNVLYAQMSEAVNFFRRFADKNPQVEYNYRQLRQAFEHLETNHKLLTPLYRTMRRAKTEIRGSEIEEYLKKFFVDRLKRHRIEFTTDPSFDNYSFYTYESVIKPVFINIINNALYWLIPSQDRKIHITYEDNRILIMNSGERIEPANLERIFTLFFTRKPGGRGIGLYLARTNLHTIGYEIFATNDRHLNRLNGACIVIRPIEKGV